MISAFRFRFTWCVFLRTRVKELHSIVLYSPLSDFFGYSRFFFPIHNAVNGYKDRAVKFVYFFPLQNHSNWSRSQKVHAVALYTYYIDASTGTLFRSAIFSTVFLKGFIIVGLGSGRLMLIQCNSFSAIAINHSYYVSNYDQANPDAVRQLRLFSYPGFGQMTYDESRAVE